MIKHFNVRPIFGEWPIFIFPTNTYGGHEIMSLEIIKSLLEMGVVVDIAVEKTNSILKGKVLELGGHAKLIDLPVKQARFEFLHTIFNYKKRSKVKEFLLKLKKKEYSSVIIVQGDIELGSIYANIASEIKLQFYSYIPYAHSAKKMGKKLSVLRDWYYPILYKKIEKFITISKVFEKDLKLYNPLCDVIVLENKVRNVDKYIKRRNEEQNLVRDIVFKIAVIGRVNFRQKGQDILFDAIQGLPKNLKEFVKVDLIGTGSDLQLLKQKVSTHGLDQVFIFHGWIDEPWDVCCNDDVLVIPSRFEGVPLVMLEGIQIGIDIIATNADGMCDYLDKKMLFDDTSELLNLLEKKIQSKIDDVKIKSLGNTNNQILNETI